jgi:two-component system response regulator FixJ
MHASNQSRPAPVLSLGLCARRSPVPTVFVVDDDPAMRESVCWLLNSAGFHSVAYACAEEYLRELDPVTPGCLLIDVRLPGMSGLELQRELAKREIAIPIIFLTVCDDVLTAVQACKAGAVDYLEKPFDESRLLRIVKSALDRDERQRTLEELRQDRLARLARLTGREWQVMAEVIAGKTNREIAAELGIRKRTVEVHRAHLMKKLAVDSVAALVRFAVASHGTEIGRGNLANAM